MEETLKEPRKVQLWSSLYKTFKINYCPMCMEVLYIDYIWLEIFIFRIKTFRCPRII